MTHLILQLIMCALWFLCGYTWGKLSMQKKICRHWFLLAEIMRTMSECHKLNKNVYVEICHVYEKHKGGL